MLNVFGECEDLFKIYEQAFFELGNTDSALITLFIPKKTPEYRAIPEHAKWHRKFQKHKKHCFFCQGIKIKRDVERHRLNHPACECFKGLLGFLSFWQSR